MVIREHLGGFRQHSTQDTRFQNPIIYLAWVAFALHARETFKISDSMAMHGILAASRVSLARYQVDPAIRRYFDDVFTLLPSLDEFARSFTKLWLEIVREYFRADTEIETSRLNAAS
jgi:hypothetical protein